jgi:hypothetical protein
VRKLFLPCLLLGGAFGLAGIAWPKDEAARGVSPQMIECVFTIVDLVPQKAADGGIGKPKTEFQENDLTGLGDDVQVRARKLVGDGQVIAVRTFQFLGVENQKFIVSSMEAKPYVRRAETALNGIVLSTISARPTGTIAAVTIAPLRIGNNKSITMDLNFVDTRFYPPDVGIVKAGPFGKIYVHGIRPTLDVGVAPVKDTEGKEFQVHELVIHNLKTKLKIPDGQAVLVKEFKTVSFAPVEFKPGFIKGQQKACPPQIMLIVSARIKKQNAKED